MKWSFSPVNKYIYGFFLDTYRQKHRPTASLQAAAQQE